MNSGRLFVHGGKSLWSIKLDIKPVLVIIFCLIFYTNLYLFVCGFLIGKMGVFMYYKIGYKTGIGKFYYIFLFIQIYICVRLLNRQNGIIRGLAWLN